jgi:pyrimidine deaminase RibD-like protein
MPDHEERNSHSGCKFFRELRSGKWGEWGRSIHVLFVTGYAHIVSQEIRGVEPAPLDIVGKPLGEREALIKFNKAIPKLNIVACSQVVVNIQVNSHGSSAGARLVPDSNTKPIEKAVRAEDRRWMELAIEESRRSVAEDNRVHPVVGVVIVKDGVLMAKAYRGQALGDHAEYYALERILDKDIVAGATVYTTLEPCTTRNHPKIPCAQRLCERKIERVVIGMLDPNPKIQGDGIRQLRNANIATELFPDDLVAIVEDLNRHFIRSQLDQNKDEPL